MSLDNLKDNISLIITMIVFLLMVGVFVSWTYNFLALSDEKLFDDNNKYIDKTLSDPTIESNLFNTYKSKLRLDTIQLNLLTWFGSLRGIFVIAFGILILFSLILKNRKTLIDNLKNMFN